MNRVVLAYTGAADTSAGIGWLKEAHGAEVVATLDAAPKADLPALVAGWLDASDASVRFALLKLITGGLRVGVSAPER